MKEKFDVIDVYTEIVISSIVNHKCVLTGREYFLSVIFRQFHFDREDEIAYLKVWLVSPGNRAVLVV